MRRNRLANPPFRVLTGEARGTEPFDMFTDSSRQLASGVEYLPFLRSLIDRYGSANAAVPGKSTVPVSIGSALLPLERTYAWVHINTMNAVADQAQAHLEVQFPLHFPSADHPFERWRNIRYAIRSDANRVTRTTQDFDRVLYADGRAQWQLCDEAPLVYIAVTNRELSTVCNLLEAGHTKDMPCSPFLLFEPDRAVIDDLQLPYAR